MKIGDVCYLFIFYSYLYHSKEHRKAIVYLMALHPTFTSGAVFSMARNIVVQCFLVVYNGISHLSLVFSWYTHAKRLEKIQVALGIFHVRIYTLSDLGVLSNLIGSLSLANDHYSPPTE